MAAARRTRRAVAEARAQQPDHLLAREAGASERGVRDCQRVRKREARQAVEDGAPERRHAEPAHVPCGVALDLVADHALGGVAPALVRPDDVGLAEQVPRDGEAPRERRGLRAELGVRAQLGEPAHDVERAPVRLETAPAGAAHVEAGNGGDEVAAPLAKAPPDGATVTLLVRDEARAALPPRRLADRLYGYAWPCPWRPPSTLSVCGGSHSVPVWWRWYARTAGRCRRFGRGRMGLPLRRPIRRSSVSLFRSSRSNDHKTGEKNLGSGRLSAMNAARPVGTAGRSGNWEWRRRGGTKCAEKSPPPRGSSRRVLVVKWCGRSGPFAGANATFAGHAKFPLL